MKSRYFLLLLAAGIFSWQTSSAWADGTNQMRMVQIANLLHARDEGDQAKGRAMLGEAHVEEGALIALLDDITMRTNEPAVVSAAITILGAVRSTNAVNRIAKLLAYNEETGLDFKEEDWFRGRRKDGMPSSYAYFRCPAREALVRIGQPSVHAILRHIAQGQWKTEDFSSPEYQWSKEKYNYAHFLAVVVMSELLGHDREKMFAEIEEYGKTLMLADEQHRLAEFLSFCKAWKSPQKR